MSRFLALGWRLLLAISLVANPLAAAAMNCHQAAAQAAATVADAGAKPPCHGHAGHDAGIAAKAPAKALPSKHGHDCSQAGCDFAACCAAGLLAPPAVNLAWHFPALTLGWPEGTRAPAAPPRPPLIRPPIG